MVTTEEENSATGGGKPGPVLEVDGLVRRFGSHVAVDAVSFHIVPGETYGLLGPNGAGKTTTISMITGLLAADEGTVRVAGEPMSPRAVGTKRHLGLVPQALAVYPDLTGRENLRFFGRLLGLGGTELRDRVEEVLEVIGLGDRAGDLVKEYSGGMARRLNIGAGLLHRPTLLVLDEPTVGVDPQSRNAILDSVAELSGTGTAVLYPQAAVLLGAPVIASTTGPPDFYVSDAVADAAVAHFGPGREQPAATVRPRRYAGIHQSEPFRRTGGGFQIAHPVIVALDLAHDRARGREMVEAWDPSPLGVTRVW